MDSFKVTELSAYKAQIVVCKFDISVEELLYLWKESPYYCEIDFNSLSEKRIKETLGVYWTLSNLLKKQVRIKHLESGKPYLENNDTKISISHSLNYIAIIVHPTNEVGIDIEHRNNKVEKVSNRFLNKDELAYLANQPTSDLLEIAWSAKETLYKIIGKEAVDFSKQLKVIPFTTKKGNYLTAMHISTEKKFRLKYKQTSEYTLVFGIDKAN